jgi:UDP-N-acetylmuramyl pentapeptide phosphotransferase/UDP-N-acetylglucosamine-1-phosphate transferase
MIVAAVAFAASLLIVPLIKRLAVLDVPTHRSSHATPKPRGGGIAIVVVTITGALILVPRAWPLMTAAGVIAIMSWIDDLKHLSAAIRFPIQILAACAVVYVYGPTKPLFAAIAVFWIAGVTNAYNFMDGIDGIAGTQAVIAGAAWFAITRNPIALLIAASSLGFLIYNWQPASIFMGDVGSAFLGFTFASLPLLERNQLTASLMAMILSPFLFDTALTLIRRTLKRERIWEAHREHLYQRLVIAGWSHRGVTMLYGAITLATSCAALALLPSLR